MSPRPHAQSDDHRLCPSRDAAASPQSAGGAPPRWPLVHPLFPRSVGWRPTKSPPIRALPIAASAACHCQSTPFVTRLDQHGPEARQDAALAPRLEVPVPRAVVAKLRGPLMPLAASAQTEDDAIQHPAQIDPPMPLGLGRVALVEDRLDDRPYIVRNFPDRGLNCCVRDNPPHNTGELSSDRVF